jgi:DNA-binding transcriptional ArsR family regulator
MPHRLLASQELSAWLGAIANPDRIRIIEELGLAELGVSSLCQRLSLPQPRISQHLGVLRTHRIVSIRRAGRHVFYRVSDPDIVSWLLSGLSFIVGVSNRTDKIREAANLTLRDWTSD